MICRYFLQIFLSVFQRQILKNFIEDQFIEFFSYYSCFFLFVLDKKSLSTPRSQRFLSFFFLEIYHFRSYVEVCVSFWVNFVRDVKKRLKLFYMRYPVSTAPFVTKTVLFPLNYLSSFADNQLSITSVSNAIYFGILIFHACYFICKYFLCVECYWK